MSGVGDQGIAAAIGAFVAGAGATIAEIVRRRRRSTQPPELEPPAASSPGTAARLAAFAAKQLHLEQEILMLKQNVTTKLDKLEESVDELCISRAKTDELLPLIREQLKELKEELRDQRRATTHKD